MCNEYNSLLKEDELILSDEIKGKTVITLGTDIDDIEIHIMRDAYDGEWKNDKKHGRGTYTYLLTGEKYVGDWERGLKKGKGTFTFSYGDYYEGDFDHGVKHGYGIIYFKSGAVFNGTW